MTPDTQGTFIAGYVAATLVYVVYGLSLWVRARRVRQRLDSRRSG